MIISGKTLKEKYPDIVTPFVDHKEIAHGMSYGLSLAGYDIRIDDANRFNLYMPKNTFGLASSLEYFKLPKNVVGFVHDKSSWARSGLSLFNTVLEPGWEGYLTLELFNAGLDKVIVPGQPIAQIIFMLTDEDTEGYNGKYQGQERGPQEAIYET